ncbi:MAG TPA: DUF1345 domain-containing protein [Desulfosarcina sp.]|nr:DUF1345 domain-containing protein [Desulfosarcina sp.]
MKLKNLTRNNVVLLVCMLALIIFYPLFEKSGSIVRDLLLTAIFFSGIFALDFSDQSLRVLLPLGALSAGATWTNHFSDNELVHLVDFVATFSMLVAIVVLMIRHIARSRNVTPTIILSAINGYLLLGLLSAVLLGIADAVHAFTAPAGAPGIVFPGQGRPAFNDYVYFGFVTLTTLGYGDVTPVSHLSRSMAILIALTGQLYMTILIAMLVGKFLARPEGK